MLLLLYEENRAEVPVAIDSSVVPLMSALVPSEIHCVVDHYYSQLMFRRVSTDVNGGGGGLGLFARDNDESMIFEEINVGLERTRKKRMSKK